MNTLAKQAIRQARTNSTPCHRCHEPIDYALPGTDPMGPVAEHTEPLAFTGTLIVPIEELTVVHRSCSARQVSR